MSYDQIHRVFPTVQNSLCLKFRASTSNSSEPLTTSAAHTWFDEVSQMLLERRQLSVDELSPEEGNEVLKVGP